jgi:DNA uptake protein ComE-like DNA-binding protein
VGPIIIRRKLRRANENVSVPTLEISMKALLTRVRLVATCGILTFSLVFPVALPAFAERPSDAGLLLWLPGLNTAREQGTPRKTDVNSATVDELAAVPGLERRQAQRITVNRPYATLQDLARAGLSPRLIEHLTALLTVDPAKAMPSGR